MLQSPMKEGQEKTIHFKDFSLSVVKTFLEFLHHGENTELQGGWREAAEVLRLAHMYQIQPLINHCINCISTEVLPEDAEEIKSMADFFGFQKDDHLQRLATHLASQCKKVEEEPAKESSPPTVV